MEFDIEKAKGILDRSFPSVKIPIHKESSYTDLNEKCKEYVWGDSSPDGYDYYMADGTGHGHSPLMVHLDLKPENVMVSI